MSCTAVFVIDDERDNSSYKASDDKNNLFFPDNHFNHSLVRC